MEAFFRASSIICPVKKAYALLSAAALVAVPSTPNAASSCASTSNSSSFFFIIFLHQFIGFFYFFSRGFLCLFLKTIKKNHDRTLVKTEEKPVIIPLPFYT